MNYYSILASSDGTVGGGEVLKYVGNNEKDTSLDLMAKQLMRQLEMIPYVKVIIILLLLLITAILIVKMFEIRSPLRGKAIVNELDHINRVKKHDKAILRANAFMQSITKIVEHSFLSLNHNYKEYWEYNLIRADIRIPGGDRVMRPEEFNAILQISKLTLIVVGILTALLISMPIGAIMILVTVTILGSIPMMVIRQNVIAKDAEIVDNFADLYLMLHYVLMEGANASLVGILRSFDKTTSVQEMHRFVDVCIHNIDTYGEFEATRHIAKRYREVPEVGKLMRLIRQANEGGDVRSELIGFRQELISAKKYKMQLRQEKLIMKASASFNILLPVLGQAVISAMGIYFDDLKGSFDLF